MNDDIEIFEIKNKIEELAHKKEIMSSKIFSSSDKLKELEYKRILVKEKLRDKLLKAKAENLNNFYAKKNKITDLVKIAKNHLNLDEYNEAIAAIKLIFEIDKENHIAKHLHKEALIKKSNFEKSLKAKDEFKKEHLKKLENAYIDAKKDFLSGNYKGVIETLSYYKEDLLENINLKELFEESTKKLNEEFERLKLNELKKQEQIDKINFHLCRAEINIANENYENAKDDFEKILLYDPTNSDVINKYNFVLKYIKEKELIKIKSEESLKRKLILSDFTAKKMASLGDFAGAIKELESILKECPVDEIKNVYEKIEDLESKHIQKIKEKQNELIQFQIDEAKEKEEQKKKSDNEKKLQIDAAFKSIEFEFEKALVNGDLKTCKNLLDSLMKSHCEDKEYIQSIKNISIRLKHAEKEKLEQEKNNIERFHEYLKKGIELYENKSFFDAFYYFKIACEINPNDKESSLFLESSLNKIKSIEDINQHYEKNKREFDEKFLEFKLKITNLVQQKYFKEALNECRRMSLLYPSQALIEKEYEKIKEEIKIFNDEEIIEFQKIEEMKKKKEEEYIEELMLQSRNYLRQNLFSEALKVIYDANSSILNTKSIIKLIEEIEIKKNNFETKKKEEIIAERQKLFKFNKYVLEGDIHFSHKDYIKSIMSYEEACLLNPSDNEVINKIKITKEYLLEFLKKDEEKKLEREIKIKECINKITDCVSLLKYQDAIIYAEEILIQYPDDENLKKIRNNLIEDKLKFDSIELKKINDEKEILKKEEEKKNKEKAIIQSQINEIYNNGLAFIRDDKVEKGIQEWKKIKFIDPSFKLIDDEIRQLRMKMREKEIEKMQHEESKKQNETFAINLYLEGKKYLREKNYLKAIEAFERSLLISKDEKLIIQEIEKAEKLFEDFSKKQIKEIDDNNNSQKEISIYLFKANRHFAKEEYKEALIILEKAYEIYPMSKEIQDGIINAENCLRRNNYN